MKAVSRLLPMVTETTRHLGILIAQERREQGWTATELAERVGISAVTLRKIERGDPSVSIGNALNTAAVLRIPLFQATEHNELISRNLRAQEILKLLPERVRNTESVDNNF